MFWSAVFIAFSVAARLYAYSDVAVRANGMAHLLALLCAAIAFVILAAHLHRELVSLWGKREFRSQRWR